MPRTLFSACFVLLTLILVPSATLAADFSPWKEDYQLALLEARQSGRPLFVVFRCER